MSYIENAAPSGGSGTVTSVGLATGAGATDALYTISGSPVTTSGTLVETLNTQTANTVFAGPSSGGAASPTFRALVSADIPSGTVLWNQIGNAAAALTLANGTNNTTFNQTTSAVWLWANTAAATSTGTNQNSPLLEAAGTYFVSGASAADTWTIQDVIATGHTSATVTNFIESGGNVVTLTITGGNFKVGDGITLTGLTFGTWLNGQNTTIITASATQLTFNDPTAHGGTASHAETGQVTQTNPFSQLTFAHSGSTRAVLGIPLASLGTAAQVTPSISPAGATTSIGFGASATVPLVICSGAANATFIRGYSGDGLSNAGAINFELNNQGTSNAVYFDLSGNANSNFGVRSNITTNIGYAIWLGNNSSFAGTTAGEQVAVAMGGSSTIGGNINSAGMTFAPASGATTFCGLQVKPTINQTSTSSGNYTAVRVNVIETSLKGSTNLLLDLQAGTTGGTSKLSVNNSGVATVYNGTATVRNGLDYHIASTDLTAQSAAIAATNLIASAPQSGAYRVDWSADITTADGVSSVLGGTGGFQVIYTSPTDSVVKTTVAGNSITSAANTTGTAVGGSITIFAKTGTAIQYSYGYTSATPGQMVYELHATLNAL